MPEAFWWLAVFTIFIGSLVALGYVFESAATRMFYSSVFREAEKRRKANERFKELVNDK